MRILILFMALLAPLVPLAMLSASPGHDDEAIRALVKNYLAARDKDDPRAVGALFTEDADQLVSTGEWRRGRDALVKGTIASTKAGGHRVLTVESIRYITADAAVADARYELARDTGTRHMWSTFVMVRAGGGWRIAAIRNMLPAPPAAK
ncbi:MAG: SgcJ/EcaC family oxidoreductase [Acidobacteria bacterium]|nr:SgcJ/EcaC family oxidoreductase [Acidobacteriota bacterium]